MPLRVSVRDQGPGIPEEFRARIFEKFSQADSSATRQKGGTGLGLHIARRFIEHMHGRIGFESAARRRLDVLGGAAGRAGECRGRDSRLTRRDKRAGC